MCILQRPFQSGQKPHSAAQTAQGQSSGLADSQHPRRLRRLVTPRSGPTQSDVLQQFLMESVLQCLLGGAIGVGIGFVCALGLRRGTGAGGA